MKVKEIKKLLECLPEDLDINYISGHGFQEITCLQYDKTLCFSNTPYLHNREDLDKLNISSICIAIQSQKK